MGESAEPTVDQLQWLLSQANKRIDELRSPVERIADQLGRSVMDGLTQKLEHGAEIPDDVLCMIAGTLQSHVRISGKDAAREVRDLYDACYERVGPALDELEARSLGTMQKNDSKIKKEHSWVKAKNAEAKKKHSKVKALTKADAAVRVAQQSHPTSENRASYSGDEVILKNVGGDVMIIVRAPISKACKSLLNEISAYYGGISGPSYDGLDTSYYFNDGVGDAITAASQMFFAVYNGAHAVTFDKKKGVVKRLGSGK